MPRDHRLRQISAPYQNQVREKSSSAPATATSGGSRKPPRRPRTKTGGARGNGGGDNRGPKGPKGNSSDYSGEYFDYRNRGRRRGRKDFTPPQESVDRPSQDEPKPDQDKPKDKPYKGENFMRYDRRGNKRWKPYKPFEGDDPNDWPD
jgi:hypothetical protein